jgi:hypothetical protein
VEEVEQVAQERVGLVGCRRSGAATACAEGSVAAGSAVASCAAAPSVRGAAVAKGGAGACEAVGSGASSIGGGLLGAGGGSGGSGRLGGGGSGLCGRDSGAAGAGAEGSVAAGSAVVGGRTAVSVLRAAVTKGRTGAGLAGCTRAHTVGGDLASSRSGGRGRLGGRSSGGSGCGSLGAHGTVATAVAKGALAARSAVIGCGAAVSGGRAAVTERATQAGASRMLEHEDNDVVRLGLQLLGSSAGSVGGDSLGTGRSRGGRCTSRLENMVLDESRTGIRRKANASDEDGAGK